MAGANADRPRDGLVVATTALGSIDGARGELRYCGYLAEELAEHSDFVEVCWLLWHGALPTAAQKTDLERELVAARPLPEPVVAMARILAQARVTPMAALRTLVSALSLDDLPGSDVDPAVNLRRSVRLAARVPGLIAAFDRLRHGHEPLPPRADLGHAADFLWRLTGRVPESDVARILDACLVLHAEHGLNPSTFTARCAISTHTDLYSAVTAGLATLKGPLHGGANAEVMRTLLEIGAPERVAAWLDQALAAGRRIMGFGHPVYLVPDPRARLLASLSRRMGERCGEPRWYQITERLAGLMAERKHLPPNVDLYSASIYHCMGIDLDLFPTLFALARVPGLTAHLMEQLRTKGQLRPDTTYVGAAPRTFVPLPERR